MGFFLSLPNLSPTLLKANLKSSCAAYNNDLKTVDRGRLHASHRDSTHGCTHVWLSELKYGFLDRLTVLDRETVPASCSHLCHVSSRRSLRFLSDDRLWVITGAVWILNAVPQEVAGDVNPSCRGVNLFAHNSKSSSVYNTPPLSAQSQLRHTCDPRHDVGAPSWEASFPSLHGLGEAIHTLIDTPNFGRWVRHR